MTDQPTMTVDCFDVQLHNGESLAALGVGDYLELTETTAGMHPGTWQVVAHSGDQAEMRAMPTAPPAADLRDRIRRAICEASGFTWLPDELMEPDEYGEHADAVLAVLPDWLAAADAALAARADRTVAEQPADRRARYAAAIRALNEGGSLADLDEDSDVLTLADAAMTIADEEIKSVRAELSGAYVGAAALRAERDQLRAEVERLRANRATAPSHLAAGIRAAADEIAGIDFHPKAHARALDLATGLVRRLRRLADEAQLVQHAPGTAILCPGCRDKGRAVCLADEAQQPETVLAEEDGTSICVCEHGGLVCSACQQQPETEAAVCGDRYDESVCQLTPGHEGSHADWNRAWDYGRATAPTEEPTR